MILRVLHITLALLPLTALLALLALITSLFVRPVAREARPLRFDPPAPDARLPALLADVVDALDRANVTHWLRPGAGLLPRHADAPVTQLGRFAPWQEGVDLAVWQADVLALVEAQTELQDRGVAAVESYFGLRLFPMDGREDRRYDFRAPFVDVLYCKREGAFVISYCCDCRPVAISSCTKKTCGCLVCPEPDDTVFPLADVYIENVRRAVSASRDTQSLMLPTDVPGLHPMLLEA